MQTQDKWGTNDLTSLGVPVPNPTCVIPGWNLFQFPTTYSMANVCDQKVLQFNLVNVANSTQFVGILYVFKTYDDTLFITASVNATFSAITTTPPSLVGPGLGFFQGQYLHSEPSLTGGAIGGYVNVWDSVLTTPSNSTSAYINMANPNSWPQ